MSEVVQVLRRRHMADRSASLQPPNPHSPKAQHRDCLLDNLLYGVPELQMNISSNGNGGYIGPIENEVCNCRREQQSRQYHGPNNQGKDRPFGMVQDMRLLSLVFHSLICRHSKARHRHCNTARSVRVFLAASVRVTTIFLPQPPVQHVNLGAVAVAI